MPGKRNLSTLQKRLLREVRVAKEQLDEARVEWEDAIVQARRLGCSYRAIAEYAGVTYEYVRRIIRDREASN